MNYPFWYATKLKKLLSTQFSYYIHPWDFCGGEVTSLKFEIWNFFSRRTHFICFLSIKCFLLISYFVPEKHHPSTRFRPWNSVGDFANSSGAESQNLAQCTKQFKQPACLIFTLPKFSLMRGYPRSDAGDKIP